MTRFPLTSAPLPDESLDSWLEYLAGLLDCSVNILLQSCGISTKVRAGFTNGVEGDFANKLAAATGATPEEVHNATLHRYPNLVVNGAIYKRLAAATTAGYCPQCLLESDGRWHLHWHAKTSMVCTTHNVMLLSHCPTCGDRPRLSQKRTIQPLNGGPLRRGPCGPTGCLPSLTNAETPRIAPNGLIIAGQRWLDAVLTVDSANIPSLNGIRESAARLLADIAAFKAAGCPITEYRAADPSVVRVLAELDTTDHVEPNRLSELVVQTLLAAAYTTPDRNQAAEFLGFIAPDTGRHLCYHRPLTDNPRTTTSATRHLFYRHELANVRTNTPSWHQDLLTTVPIEPMPTSYLPSRIWPEVLTHHPAVPAAVRGLIPLTSVVSLAALGSSLPPNALRHRFNIVIPYYRLDIELQALWACTNRQAILDYYLDLHAALTSAPPAIDYHRRRTTFPTPRYITATIDRSPHEKRFIWQLLTGSDPFANTGSDKYFGPTIRYYLGFVNRLQPDEVARLQDDAERLLRLAGIHDEPLLYTPTFSTTGFVSKRKTGPLTSQVDRPLVPGTHIVDLAAAEEHRTPMAVLNYAITGDGSLACALVAFINTVDQPTSEAAAAHLSRGNPDQNRSEGRIEHLLGRAVYTRARAGNPRALTRAGRALLEACISQHEDLDRAASAHRTPPLPAPGSSVLDV